MPMPLPNTRPISDFRTHLSEICEEATETQAPIFMTKNGRATLVVMDCQAYEQQRQHDRYVLKLREAEIEAKYHPHAISAAELDATIERTLSTWEA